MFRLKMIGFRKELSPTTVAPIDFTITKKCMPLRIFLCTGFLKKGEKKGPKIKCLPCQPVISHFHQEFQYGFNTSL